MKNYIYLLVLVMFISVTFFDLVSIHTDSNVSISNIYKRVYANPEGDPSGGCDTKTDHFYEDGACENNDPCSYWMAAGTLYTCVDGTSSTCEDGWSYFNEYCNCDRYNYNDVVQAICY